MPWLHDISTDDPNSTLQGRTWYEPDAEATMTRKVSTISSEDKARIYFDVVDRDYGACILCGGAGQELAHIVPRNRSVKDDERLWIKENLCLLCADCHDEAENMETRIAMMRILHARWNYDYHSLDIFEDYIAFLEE